MLIRSRNVIMIFALTFVTPLPFANAGEETSLWNESGAIAVVSFPKPKGGSGFPARVSAIVL